MTLLTIVLLILLLVVVVRKDKQLSDRIDRLEHQFERLENEIRQQRSQATGREAEAGQPLRPEPEKVITTAGATHDRSSEEEAMADSGPPARDASEESLSDLVLEADAEVKSTAPPEPDTAGQGPAPPPRQPSPRQPSQWSQQWQTFKATVDWEQFTGIKLFAWLGGLAFFIAAAFFVKLSIDRNWIPPEVRLAISALLGVALILGAGFFSEARYRVLRHTLVAAGLGALFSVVFAATLYYQYLTEPLGFGMLALISAAAFVLAVFHRSRAVCVLGTIGACVTPVLVGPEQGNIAMLLGYLAVINAGVFLVARRLDSHGLLLVAAAGTVATLGLESWHGFRVTAGVTLSLTWIANTALFTLFLWLRKADPRQIQSARWTGFLTFAAALALSVALLGKPGWPCLLMITAALAAAMVLAWRIANWHGYVIPYAAAGFLVTLVWVLFKFEPAQFSMGFLLLLVYGAFGGLGPLVLVWRHGLSRSALFWFRVFPLAMVLVSLAVIFQQPVVSFWFWPLLLALELIGIAISVLFRAFIQVGLLMLLFVVGALDWLFNVPGEMLGIGFFGFVMVAGIILCAGLFVLIKRLPDLMAALQLDRPENAPRRPVKEMPHMAQWLAAAPAAGVCVLLGASFLVSYPHYPHPGMATLICFLVLVLVAVRRLGFAVAGVAALLGGTAAQAVFVFHPEFGPPAFFSALIWSGVLFVSALASPFLFFRSTARWKYIWNGWALFEAAQAVFILYVTQSLWPAQIAHWAPLVPALCKLPVVAILLRRLADRPERNVILAFHGGVLLFYLSALPVLVLNHGWIGLTFVFEAAALLWLNRRIAHPGLRWVALAMAPLGLAILGVNLPRLKTIESLPLINSATLSVAAAVAALLFAVRQAGYPQRRLKVVDLPNYFLWLAVGTGFFLVNLSVADLFAEQGTRFAVWPGNNFTQWACHALAWVALGALLRRLMRLPEVFRRAGFWLVAAGALGLIVLPMMLPYAAVSMRPLFNAGLALYLPLIAALYYLFHKEAWDDQGSVIKNIMLALFLGALFVTFKFQKGIVMAPGYPFALLTSKTPSQAAASAIGWLVYALGLLAWPRRLDRPFRLAGLVLMLLAIVKALSLPFRYRSGFAEMTPLFNSPGLMFLLLLAALLYLTLRSWDQRWPVPSLAPKAFWGIILAVAAFIVMNIEIASVFAIKDRPFSMLTHGSLAMQLAYSIGWLLFAIGLLAVGIRWNVVKVRWAAIIAIVVTACKIFILDVSSLGQMYRVASLMGLAVVMGMVSYLYQRFLSQGKQDA